MYLAYVRGIVTFTFGPFSQPMCKAPKNPNHMLFVHKSLQITIKLIYLYKILWKNNNDIGFDLAINDDGQNVMTF
jgi:hypothetical protein